MRAGFGAEKWNKGWNNNVGSAGTNERCWERNFMKSMVGVTGFEPATPTSRRYSGPVLGLAPDGRYVAD
jgi:hypothetical protein